MWICWQGLESGLSNLTGGRFGRLRTAPCSRVPVGQDEQRRPSAFSTALLFFALALSLDRRLTAKLGRHTYLSHALNDA